MGSAIAAQTPGTPGATFDLANASYAFVGVASDRSGFSVASAGDVDGDGLDDLLIGAYHCYASSPLALFKTQLRHLRDH